MSTESRRATLRMMVRPRWVLALVAALGTAAAFAVLGQWQLERAVEQAEVVEHPTEELRAFAGVAEPGAPTAQAVTGQKVEVAGAFVPGDTVLVADRRNDGTSGYWVVAHLEVADAPEGGLPVALGWAPDAQVAQAAADRFDAAIDPEERVAIVGRFLPSEAPVAPADDEDPFLMRSVAVAQLVNVWADYDDRPVYFGYVTAAEPVEGLEVIYSPPPQQNTELNWLNIFYAVEWVVFAGFAIYLWYRLVRDAVEREREEAAEAEAAAGRAPVDAG
ncbi:SURF1 family protein [Agromyces lapidis]|uniref:SURF1-like protein n=1 Tax=Agromyces lapidis TaxID=279574 RepID=A0ABV5SMY8_9MICO|nr:SURF1 family protein [Agromyces lapidis]